MLRPLLIVADGESPLTQYLIELESTAAKIRDDLELINRVRFPDFGCKPEFDEDERQINWPDDREAIREEWVQGIEQTEQAFRRARWHEQWTLHLGGILPEKLDESWRLFAEFLTLATQKLEDEKGDLVRHHVEQRFRRDRIGHLKHNLKQAESNLELLQDPEIESKNGREWVKGQRDILNGQIANINKRLTELEGLGQEKLQALQVSISDAYSKVAEFELRFNGSVLVDLPEIIGDLWKFTKPPRADGDGEGKIETQSTKSGKGLEAKQLTPSAETLKIIEAIKKDNLDHDAVSERFRISVGYARQIRSRYKHYFPDG